ncbi:hypothetical protein BKA57DRAFT_471878 [Linnemannia elongata]|nr:hypothetical protein BKA57DRAFT_471878 [Linnemannia elongata]
METEYLDVVNKELHDIQEFFAHYYYPSPPLTNPQPALTVLPLLKPNTTLTSPPSFSPPSSSHDTDTLHGGDDDLFDFPSLYHTSPPPPPSSSCDEEKDQYVADLRDRYKQLKAVQDQMHLELTRSRILRQSIEVVGVTKVDDDARVAFSPMQEKKKGGHSGVGREIESSPFGDSPGVMGSMASLPFNESSARTTTIAGPAPHETTGTTITTTTTGTGTTIITTTTSTATAETGGSIPILPQELRQTNPFTIANVRRLIDMIYQDAKTLLSSSPIMTYTILGMVFGVLLVGWLDCANYDIDNMNIINNTNNNDNNNHRIVDLQAPMTDHPTHSTFGPAVPEDDTPRYPWPRH